LRAEGKCSHRVICKRVKRFSFHRSGRAVAGVGREGSGKGRKGVANVLTPFLPFPVPVRAFFLCVYGSAMRLWERAPRGGGPRVGPQVGLSIYMPEIETVCLSITYGSVFIPLSLLFAVGGGWWVAVGVL